ncbi:hypothetical protein PV08_06341 [Exophiala spinifera]|uniref:Uncharacterized protein n=1 Tax=Exophiala spinifera TaxID=91928 RepID=A0A0D2BCD5_9EURO|nr:uncharacterized protein PV08_06341 [Exophiala spinifera]KIW16290.1 hypothetical protein PV08_06341 [Exophiala spinifera]
MIPAEAMLRDEETTKRTTSTETKTWSGPGRFFVVYAILNNTLFNEALVTPRDNETPIRSWNHPGDVDEQRAKFSSFSPLVRKLIGLIEK